MIDQLQSRIKTQTKYCVLSVAGNDNNINENANVNIIFTIKDTKYVLVVTLSARDNQKLSKYLSIEFQRSVYSNEYKTKCDNENTTNEL